MRERVIHEGGIETRVAQVLLSQSLKNQRGGLAANKLSIKVKKDFSKDK